MPDSEKKIILTDGAGGPLSGLPVYARMVAWIGLPSALCIFLIWIVTGDLKAQVRQQTADITVIKLYMSQQAEVAWQLVGINARVCLNTSKTDADRIACVSVSRTFPK